jgi:hypothetical protein
MWQRQEGDHTRLYSTVVHLNTARVKKHAQRKTFGGFFIFKPVRLRGKVLVSFGLCTEISVAPINILVRENIEMRAEMSVSAWCKVSNTVHL